MRLSKLLIGILLFIGSATYAQHSPQDTLTAYYYRYPQQAIKDAEALYRQAIKNNDTPLLIKSLILKTTFTLYSGVCMRILVLLGIFILLLIGERSLTRYLRKHRNE